MKIFVVEKSLFWTPKHCLLGYGHVVHIHKEHSYSVSKRIVCFCEHKLGRLYCRF